MIIVEGPDGAGKTTLVKHLVEKYPELSLYKEHGERNQLHAGNIKLRVMGALKKDMYTVGDPRPRIYDRLYFSELVYGPTLRGSCHFGGEDQAFIERMLIALNAPVIFCLPPYSVAKKNVEETLTDQMEGVSDHLHDIYEQYDKLYLYSKVQAIRYDYTTGLSVVVEQAVEQNIREFKRRDPFNEG